MSLTDLSLLNDLYSPISHLGRDLEFYQELEISLKQREMVIA